MCETLEERNLLSGAEFLTTNDFVVRDDALFTTDAAPGFFSLPDSSSEGNFGDGASDNGHTVMGLDDFWADGRFARFAGRSFTSVILDTGINPNSNFFGPDLDSNGVPDRIVYQYDFANNDNDATDLTGHGSNVASAVASSNSTYRGVAPEAGIIALRVFNDAGQGSFTWLEQSLQWVISHAQQYNIASVNMSLGDSQNWAARGSMYGIGDELAVLAQMGVIVVAAAGNSFFQFGGAMGMAYPAADPNVISVGAVYGQTGGSYSYGSGAQATTSRAGAITPFSQRSPLLDIFAPGAPILGAGQGSSTVSMHGTSQASPQIAGVAVLAQQMATELLGRRLNLQEFRSLLVNTGTNIFDGDDEVDNVANTNRAYRLVNVHALGEAIWAMRPASQPVPTGNHLPTLTTITDLTGAVEGRRAIVTYEMLAAAADDADSDGDAIGFRIQSVNSGTLTLNGRLVRTGMTVINPGDSLVWTPANNATGLQSAFTVVAHDGEAASSTAVPVRINLAVSNAFASSSRSLSIVGAPGASNEGTGEASELDQAAEPVAAVQAMEFVANPTGQIGLRLSGIDRSDAGGVTLKRLMGIESGAESMFRRAA